ncbi:hypothetical protein ASB57_13735 [Bordetella sp. N]|nr:hypothetical protein ASB57_13735 [Bordetella sp. N]
MASFVISVPVLLLAGMGVIEIAYWHITRQVLNVALMEAARAGATANGRLEAMERAFLKTLRPLPTSAGRWRRIHDDSGSPAWRIDVLAPPTSAYADFGSHGLRLVEPAGTLPATPAGAGILRTGSAPAKIMAIRNDYQAEEHARRLGAGWPGGRGPKSGLTIFEANILRLRLSYQLPPLSPLTRAVLRAVAPTASASLAAVAARAGNVLIVEDLAMDMQSHPAAWPSRRIEPG